jgi:hypothetical protein
LLVAVGRHYLALQEAGKHCETYAEIARMLTGLIQHLERENRHNRWFRGTTKTDD